MVIQYLTTGLATLSRAGHTVSVPHPDCDTKISLTWDDKAETIVEKIKYMGTKETISAPFPTETVCFDNGNFLLNYNEKWTFAVGLTYDISAEGLETLATAVNQYITRAGSICY
ncbi:hypothetical protein KIPB_009855 [Kipferlia bialata]|uniref:Uncharacterized protein n=1 Tax=Kipferlia bialata TaxID=797122 RepID=A0A9K3D2A6_9EUKA|nr:hypothetical protein KIPB_009855 [Kipferlia bialata]|eukprot:g9855.t1